MPQAVCINHTHPRWKVQQLQAHSQDDPCHTQTGPDRPGPANLLILNVTEATPECISHNSDSNIGGHVVCVIPGPEREVQDMQRIQRDAKSRPEPQQALFPRLLPVEPEHSDGRIVQPIQHIRARSKVVQLFRNPKVSGMENHAKRPARQAHVSKPQVVFPQRVRRGYLVAQLRHAPVVREVVEEGEDDAKRLLHAHEAVEGPFTVELVDGLHVRGIAGETLGGHDVLACVIAFGGTVPEEQTAVQGCAV
jgi:hypothetical protein